MVRTETESIQEINVQIDEKQFDSNWIQFQNITFSDSDFKPEQLISNFVNWDSVFKNICLSWAIQIQIKLIKILVSDGTKSYQYMIIMF